MKPCNKIENVMLRPWTFRHAGIQHFVNFLNIENETCTFFKLKKVQALILLILLHSLIMPQYPPLWLIIWEFWVQNKFGIISLSEQSQKRVLCVCCHPALTWRRGVSARDMEVGGHWDTLAKSSSTSSWCRVSCEVPGSCRAITMALVLSARNMRWRHRSKAWLTSCRALDTPHGACSMEVCYYTHMVWHEVDITLLFSDYYSCIIRGLLIMHAYLTFGLQQTTIQTGRKGSHPSIITQNDNS